MTKLVTFSSDRTRAEELIKLLDHVDADYVYLAHHYGRDDWHGAGVPYRSLRAALESFNATEYDGAWVDSRDLGYPNEPNWLWWPLQYNDTDIPRSEFGETHPYIEKARIQS